MLKATSVHEELPASSRWREFWGRNASLNQSSCAPANQVLDDPEDFQKQMEKRTTPEAKRFAEQADASSLRALLSGSLDDAHGQREKTQRSQSIIKRVGKKTVVFANNFSSFLQAYSGVIEIMKGADQQYGGLAYSTLSLLLIVGVNKQQKEDRIDSALLTLQREFARLEVLRDLYPSETIKKAITEAYSLGISFVREVTLYYSRPTYRRVLEAITKPSQLGIDIRIAAITDAMTEIQKESASLDSKRLYEIQRNLDEVQRDVTRVDGAVESLHVRAEDKSLSVLREQLLPGGQHPRNTLEKYSLLVTEAFRNPGRLSPLDIERLMRNQLFTSWEENRKASMMLLFGRTEITSRDYCWLSPVVFHLIKLYRDQKRVIIFHCCHDRVFMEPDTPAHVVLSSLVYQLLEAKATILRDEPRYHELLRKIADPVWRTNPPQEPFAVLGELLNAFPEVYVLLDRVDRIKGHADRFMDPLIRMVKKSKCIIKVFLVASSNNHAHPDGKITPDVLTNAEEELGSDRFSSLRIDQK